MKILNVPNRRMKHIAAQTDRIIESCATISETMHEASKLEPKARWYYYQQRRRLARLHPWAFKDVVPAGPFRPAR